jgi:aspartyl protease family protein
MYKALTCVIVAGASIGFLVPGGHGASAPAKPVTRTAQGYAIPVETRIHRSGSGHFFVDALVNGQPVHFIVDTGATDVVLTVEDAQRIGLDVDPSKFDVIGQGVSGPARGQMLHFTSVEVDGKERLDVAGAVVEGGDMSLLGQSYLSRLNSVQMNGEEMILR